MTTDPSRHKWTVSKMENGKIRFLGIVEARSKSEATRMARLRWPNPEDFHIVKPVVEYHHATGSGVDIIMDSRCIGTIVKGAKKFYARRWRDDAALFSDTGEREAAYALLIEDYLESQRIVGS